MVVAKKEKIQVKRLASEKEKKAAAKRNSIGTASKATLVSSKQAKGKGASPVESKENIDTGSKRAKGPALDINNDAYDAIYKTSKRTMGRPLLHAEDLNRIDHILRVFDMDITYGPSIGMTRLERWERAKELDLDPPAEIKDILLTAEGQNDKQYSRDVFHNLVAGLE